MKKIYVWAVGLLRSSLEPMGALRWLEARSDRLLFRYVRSLFSIHSIEDMTRLDLPWWTFDSIGFVQEFLESRKGKAVVFEYGSGASTIWLAKRSGSVTSIEHDRPWFAKVSRLCAALPNVDLSHVEAEPGQSGGTYGSAKQGWRGYSFERYVLALRNSGKKYDLIVVDGRSRSACLAASITNLKDDGIILLDNSRRRRYRESVAASGLRRREFRGLAPGLPYREATTVLWKTPLESQT